MQISLPAEITVPAPSASDLPSPAASTQPQSSFAHYLGSGDARTAPEAPEAKVTPSLQEDDAELASEKEPEEAPLASDSLIAATLAALTLSFANPPIAAPLPGELGPAAAQIPGTSDSSDTFESTVPVASTTPLLVPTPEWRNQDFSTPVAPSVRSEEATSASSLDESVEDMSALAKRDPTETAATNEPKPSTASPEDRVVPEEAFAVAERPVDAEPSDLKQEASVTEDPAPAIGTSRQLGKESAQNPQSETSNQSSKDELAPAVIEEVVPLAVTPRGTPAALQRSAMTDALLTRQAKAKAAEFSSSEPLPVIHASARESVSPSPAVHTATKLADAPAEPLVIVPTTAPNANAISPTPAASRSESPAMAKTEALSQSVSIALDNVHRMTEQLHSTGRRQVELEVQLHDNQKLTISLQMERGELRTIFKTDSSTLRDALAQNWGQVTEKNSDRSLRLNPPVFESASTQNGFSGDPRQQSRDGRNIPEAEAEGQRITLKALPVPVAMTVVSKPSLLASAAATNSSLELYA